MRATVLAAAVAAVVLAGCANTPEPAHEQMTVSRVHEVPGRTKQQLCTAARDWAALTFRDSKAVVEVFDPEQGKMIGKGRVMLTAMMHVFPTDFTLLVECRDGRARATYDNVQPTNMGVPFPLRSSGAIALRSQAEARIGELDAGLVEYLKSPKVGGGDW